jgi:molecular chaperone GrpE
MTDQPNAGQVRETKENKNKSSKNSTPIEKPNREPTIQKKLTKKELQQALDEAHVQVAKYKTQLAYKQADYENYVKSMERREANLRLQANRELILKILPILDDLERAQLMIPHIEENEAFIEGFTMLVENLKSALTNSGVTVIDCKGVPFDPLRHEVVIREESAAVAPNTIIEELRKGYLLKGALLRPSMVKIAVAPTPPPKAGSERKMTKDSNKNEPSKK